MEKTNILGRNTEECSGILVFGRVVMSRFVTMMNGNVTIRDIEKWRMESILSIPTNGLYNATPILMRYKVKFTFENYRYSIKYL